MDPNEIAKTLTKAGEIALGSIPFTAAVKRMLGPAADELAEMWRDRVRAYRYEREVKLLEKVERIAAEHKLKLGQVPPKILFPLLEGASLEENEQLHDMWAALLANAASAVHSERVRPGFIATLKQMSPDEAALLQAIAQSYAEMQLFDDNDLMRVYVSIGYAPAERNSREEQAMESMRFLRKLLACRDGLVAEQLIKRSDGEDRRFYGLTSRGVEFTAACRPPASKTAT